MALTTLPYPNMDFTPLDILTADELDHIVANIEALNGSSIVTNSIVDNAVTTAKIANNSVTEDKLQKNIITVRGTNSTTVYSPQSIIPLSVTEARVGTKLSASNNGIVIGSGVNHIKISANVYFFGNNTGAYGYICLRRNNVKLEVYRATAYFANTSFDTATISPVVISVNEGDIFTLMTIDNTVGVQNQNTYMTVEVVD